MEKHTEGELALLDALQSLSDDYTVYFQPHINFAHPDIIIVHKTGGVLIVEVKDWNLSGYQYQAGGRIQDDYLTLRDEPGKIKSPFTQARDYKEELYSALKASVISERVKFGKNEKYLYSVIRTSVFFYNAGQEEVESLYNSGGCLGEKDGVKVFREHYYYWCREDLSGIVNSIDSLLGKPHSFFTVPVQNAITKLLTVSEEWMEQSEVFNQESLDTVQKELSKPNPGGMIRVKGAAGSGKTVVIASKAVNCYRHYGMPVLILTYNITLCNYIRDAISKQTRGMSQRERSLAFEVVHYDGFIPQVFKKINVVGPHPGNYMDLTGEIDWKQYHRDADMLLEKHLDLLAKYDCQYKTVLIDEAQDYETEWFETVQKCFFKPEADFLIVADQKQNIYQRKAFISKLPAVPGFRGPWRILKSSYRLSHEVLLLAKDFMNKSMPEYGDDDLEEIRKKDVGVVEYHAIKGDLPESYGDIWRIVDNFKKANGNDIARNDICILFGEIYQLRDFEYAIRKKTDGGVKFQMMCETKEEYDDIIRLSNGNKIQEKKDLHDIQLARKYAFRMNPGTVKLCTIHSFKGWEINTVVIVLDKNRNIQKEHIYTALTRAKCNAVIIDLGGNEFGPYFDEYVKKMKNRVPVPDEYEISDKQTDIVFSTKYGICRVVERVGKDGLKVTDKNGKEISFMFDHYKKRNQACYVKRIVKRD